MTLDATTNYISTIAVAKALGVSVSTVKRWVDEGVLPAHKTAGGHRKLLVADVLQLARRGDLPHVDLSQLSSQRRSQKVLNVPQLADKFYRALIAGDAESTRAVLHGEYRRGLSIDKLADQIIAPAMQRIGRDWELSRIDVMEEHRASQLCTSALHVLKGVLEARAGKQRPVAVGGAPEHDETVLPTLLAQMVLLDAGWDAVNLGPRTPFKSFQKAIKDLRPRLLWLTVSHLTDDAGFIAGYRELYRQAEKAGVAVAIGGRAITEQIRSQIVYSTCGDAMAHLAAFAQTLHPRPRPPRRGRPRKA